MQRQKIMNSGWVCGGLMALTAILYPGMGHAEESLSGDVKPRGAAYREIAQACADEMLAQGDVEGAEEYMEERRRFLVSLGYYIRKLNQAYFAFHGSYSTSPTSVDPIGEALQRLRQAFG